MATLRQIEANYANAQRSTGPHTAEGKARVRFNAVKHGLSGQHLVIPTEELAEFEAFRDDLLEHLQPSNPLEASICIRLIAALWRAGRCGLMETAGFHVTAPKLSVPPEAPAGALPLGALEHYGDVFTLISRYEDRHERSFYRALQQLLSLRKSPNAKQTQLQATQECPAPPPPTPP